MIGFLEMILFFKTWNFKFSIPIFQATKPILTNALYVASSSVGALAPLLRRYKFFLSFENSRCRYYITEKFFSNAIAIGTVPIVAGCPRHDYELVAPTDSFIHVDDFKHVEELGERINYSALGI